jgi:flavodoxin
MKSLVVYSSRTGNTKKVAQAIYEVLPEPKDVFPVEESPDPNGYGFLALGFWVDKGRPDAKIVSYMARVKNIPVGLFGTLGANPASKHAEECIRHAAALLWDARVLGTFMCQGRIDPGVIEAMKQTAADIHRMTPERITRIKMAATHPNDMDLKNAQNAFRRMVEKVFAARIPNGKY